MRLFSSVIREKSCISIEEVAEPANSFNYEMACHVSRRVPRVYFKDGNKVGEVKYLDV